MSRAVKAALAIGAVIVVAVAVVLITSGGEASADEVRFQTVSDAGPDPFTASAAVPKASAEETAAASESDAPAEAETPSDPTEAIGSSSPDIVEDTVCDREKLVAELGADADKLSAWAKVAGVDDDPQAVAAFIRELRPVTLERDIQVTAHSYVDGEAKSYQAILAKGTAALVNAESQPVARCQSGSPLTKPGKLATDKTIKCIDCPPNFKPPPQPPPRVGTTDVKVDPTPIPVIDPKGPVPVLPTDPIAKAKTTLEQCRTDKGALDKCKTEYEEARRECAANPVNPLCDSTICFDGEFVGPCTSYIDPRDIIVNCSKLSSDNKLDCLARQGGLWKRCAADPTKPECKRSPAEKANDLRLQCGVDPGSPQCAAMQIDCLQNPVLGCKFLQDKCQLAPDRPDCKAARDFQAKCAKAPAPPECRPLIRPVGPGLVAPQEPGAEEGVGEEEAAPEGGQEGGEAPAPEAGQEQPQPQPEPEPEPENNQAPNAP